MLDRIGEAELELDTARAGFKHRYSVIWPAELPSQPSYPKVPRLLGAGMAASLLFAIFLTTLIDARAGKLVEPWQIKRVLDIPLLGRVPR
jgi:uncharacterized protein involved in exopolysaccharide biosynthesis